MKTLKFSILSALFVFLSLSGIQAKERFTKKITNEFDVKTTDSFIIQNKFGDITIENWEKTKILIEVELVVEAKNAEQAKKAFHDVNLDIRKSGNTVFILEIVSREGFVTGFSNLW